MGLKFLELEIFRIKRGLFCNSVDFNPGLKYHSRIDQIHWYKLLHLKLLISLAVSLLRIEILNKKIEFY